MYINELSRARGRGRFFLLYELIDRIGRRRWVASCFAVGGLLLVTLGALGATSVTLVIATVAMSYGIIGSANAVLYLYTPEIYATPVRAIGTAAATCWLRLASAAAPLLLGYMVMSRGMQAVFVMLAVVALVGMWAATLMLETQNQRLEDTIR